MLPPLAGRKRIGSKSAFMGVILVFLGIIQICAFAQSRNFDLSISREDRLKVFDAAWKAIDKHFFDPRFNDIDWVSMKTKYRPLAESAANKPQLQRVLQTMFNELHTSHTFANMGFSFGTGIVLYKLEGRSVIYYVDQGSPADLAGVQSGWVINSWKGDCWNGDQSNAIQYLDSQQQIKKLEIACKAYAHAPDRPERSSRMLSPDVAYIGFTKFRGSVDVWLAAQVDKVKGAMTIVFDLRGNRGGDLEETIRCLNLLYDKPLVIGRFQFRKGSLPVKIEGRKDAYSGKLLVLIDGRTGSGGDMFAAAIQDTGRGTLIGRRTAGAILLGKDYNLPQGYLATVAEGDYFTAKNVRLEGRGVAPDEMVDYTFKDFQEHNDPDLDRVRALLRR
jgi:carboxyl-terminal processing protease